jgi:hypothetical protein
VSPPQADQEREPERESDPGGEADGRPADSGSDLAAELLALERALAVRDRAAIEGGFDAALDDAFEEVGASGRRWDRAETMELLAEGARHGLGAAALEIEDFRVDLLDEALALATYRTVVRRADGSVGSARRASLWIRRGGRWRMRYHQGTPIPEGTI